MIKRLSFFFAASILLGCAPLNHQVISHENEPILLGRIDRSGLESLPYAEWFKPAYQEYAVDMARLGPSDLNGIELLVFMGTWCSDSQLQVPHFLRILDNYGFSARKLKLIALDNHPDRKKTSPDGAEKGWNISLVPTFVVLKNGQEIGRIVETPLETLEQDLAKILHKN